MLCLCATHFHWLDRIHCTGEGGWGRITGLEHGQGRAFLFKDSRLSQVRILPLSLKPWQSGWSARLTQVSARAPPSANA